MDTPVFSKLYTFEAYDWCEIRLEREGTGLTLRFTQFGTTRCAQVFGASAAANLAEVLRGEAIMASNYLAESEAREKKRNDKWDCDNCLESDISGLHNFCGMCGTTRPIRIGA